MIFVGRHYGSGNTPVTPDARYPLPAKAQTVGSLRAAPRKCGNYFRAVPKGIISELFEIKMSKTIKTCAYSGADSSLAKLGIKTGKALTLCDGHHDRKNVEQKKLLYSPGQ